MNLYLLQMIQRSKYRLSIIILLSLVLWNVDSIDPMPLCLTCASDDGYSCITCSACQQYATLVSDACVCATGYYMNQDNPTNIFCDRCHTSCSKCFGPLASNCLSCSDRFDYNQTGSQCTAPNNATDQTLVQSYSFYGFNYLPGWSYGTYTSGLYATYCNGRSILGGINVVYGGGSGYTMTYTYSSPNIPYHFGLRIKMAFYIFNAGGSTAQAWISVSPSTSVLNRTYSYGTTAINNCGTDYIHFNIDDTFPHEATTATIQIGLTQAQWFGIRQFYVIAKKCKVENCSKCDGYLPTQCTQCVDTRRIPTNPILNGTCLCDGIYYQEPYSGECVDPCPSVPIQYYGDPTTRYCKTSCPSGYFALDDTYRCETDCPTTSSKSGFLLFKDTRNRKCVSVCPDTEPYAYPLATDRTCYATCPGSTYATDAVDRRCVTTCPYNSTYKLFGHNGKCVSTCPVGFWADPGTIKCVSDCDTASTYPFKDNSTGVGYCVSMCPAPNFFGDTTNYTCVETCPNTTFGERYNAAGTMIQMCVSKCNSPRWGLVTDNRKCVDYCPKDFWGQPTNRVCTNVSTDCNPRFADNYTRVCVTALTCSLGFFGQNSTWRCVPYCPQGSFAHPDTKLCQAQCDAPYFRDDGTNECVANCKTIGTYADVSSSRTCVTACNSTGTTPWADESTRTCVNDCNNTVNIYLADNTTWKCVYNCPPNYYADWTSTAPKCVASCPATYYADNSTGTGVCVQTCSKYPRKFGDVVASKNVCVDVCLAPNLGDQTGYRLCQPTCPSTPSVYYAQSDSQRLCVLRCKDKTYGWANVCLTDPKQCPAGYFGDDSTNLCVNPCPATQGTFGDPESKMCVRKCPLNPNYPTSGPATYYADISNRLCVLTCNASYSTGLFGNNATRTCQTKCLDYNSYAQTQTTNRICVARCLPASTFNYANNDTKVCGTSINCQLNYYGENTTQLCVEYCPIGSFAYKTNVEKLCVDVCPKDSSNVDWYGDVTTSKRICVTSCPSLPLRFADPTTKLCVEVCPSPLYGDTVARKCVSLCPDTYFAHQPTRRCVSRCPDTFFGDDTPTVRFCHPNSALCGTRFGDPYKNLCVGKCTGPTPVSYFGYLDDCVQTCPSGTYADSYNSARLCVTDCNDYSGSGGPDLYGDPLTRTCEPKCIKPLTWADFQTRDCQSPCSALPIPTYAQNFNMRCVTSLNCPTSPSMTFGDNTTRSCLSNCSNNEFGDPTSRNCVTQCPKDITTGTQHYYGDISTGINLCVTVCPSTPRLFGNNASNLCVPECPQPLYGDQTGKRSCLAQCPIVSGVYYYSQNVSRICVKVCASGTWGRQSSRECVEDPFLCGTQWADNTTNMCVTTCPATSNLFGDQTTGTCVPVCPSPYFSDDKTRTCVRTCPASNGPHGTFGDNSTRVCEQTCSEPNAFADTQTVNRYCVLLCSQTPNQAFADPSTKSCVSKCPVFPSLFAQTTNFRCVQKCVSPYFADTNTRRCELGCPSGQFKLNGSQLCVSVCPQNPDLYGDSNSGFCQSTCTNSYHRYPTERICISSCQAKGLFMYNFTCVKFCPYGYYADATGICVTPCTSNTFGQNSTTTCRSTCITGFAQGTLCVAKCDDGLWGQGGVCKNACTAPARASNQTNLCVSNCEAGTFLLNGKCQSACTTGYADPAINECQPSCTLGRYGDPTTKKCVETCPVGYYRDATGYCLNDCSSTGRRADNITWNCENKCSNGSWGHNAKCEKICPSGFYGYTVDRDCYSIANRPDTTLFADNNTQTWVSVCPLSPLRYGDRTKKQCVPGCISGQFADPVSRQCETTCTGTSYFADSTTNKCVLICPDLYFANTANNKCEDICSASKFAYAPTHQCVDPCPVPYFGFRNATTGVRTCVLKCPTGTFSEGRLCVTGCATLFADTKTNACVADCIDSYANIGTHTCEPQCASFGKIADNSTNTCVSQCPTDPDLYEENGVCVPQCSTGLFADPTPGLRGCRSGCTQGLWAQPESKRCLATCKPGYFARNLTNTCDTTCLSGQFADLSTGYCQSTCPAPTFADSLTHKCVEICSGNQFGEGRVCVSKCSAPNYANPLTRVCQTACPQFDYLFAQDTTRSCVKDCKIVANSYADTAVRKCVDNCTRTLQYALISEGKCVALCPEGLFMDNTTKICEPKCTNGFAQLTSRYCVARCFGAPDTYGHIDANGVKTCKYKCLSSSQNLYADNRTNLCVQTCTTPMYSDPLTGNCVLFCPQGLYAQDTDRTCSPTCNTTQFADNLTRSCVNECPTATEETFGYLGNNTCMKVCPTGYFARNDTKQCVLPINCKANSWADPISKYCVTRCPSDPLSFGYDTEKTCVSTCPASEDLFGQFINQKCVAACGLRNGKQTYEDTHTRTCVFTCPIKQELWADTTDDRCKKDCSGGQIRDNSTQMCVGTCPSDPESYADTATKFCVRTCPDGTFASDATTRICTDDCSLFSLTYGDNTTNRCTAKCPIPYFANNITYLCVLNCPQDVDYYADSHSRTCVKNCPKTVNWVSYADPDSRSCVTKCPEGMYAVNSTQRCVQQCPLNQYADQQLNLCVADCTVRPGFYKEINSRVCVAQCPTNTVQTFKYDVNHSCVYFASGQSGCPGSYYANPVNKMCTTRCPAGYFAEDSSKMCVKECQTNFVADPTDRRCKTYCTSTPEYYADDLNKVCVQHCPAPYFRNNQTYRCTEDCTTTPLMFRYYETRECVFNCHHPFFAYAPNRTCLAGCPTGYFAQQSTRSCVQTCDAPYFADDSTNRCVDVCPSTPDYYGHLKICRPDCPNNFYRDNSTRMCVANCPIQPLMFADNSTNTCVKYCPADQNYFADNITRKCVLNCSSGLFSEVQSRTCVKTCPKNLETYADPTTRVCQPTCPATYYSSDVTKECVKLCPDEPVKTYAHINKCLEMCPEGYYGENTTRTCRTDCSNVADIFADDTTNLCVTTCPVGLFAQNTTDTCVNTCPVGSYADPTTRICVQECPGTQRLYADPSNQQCVNQCSAGYYGDSLQWVCLLDCPDTASGYRLEVGRICVEECPSPYFALVPTRNCVLNCGFGLYGDPVTRTCKNCPSECPTCLSPSNCLTCIDKKYLSYGMCVDECILNDEVANYANDETKSCVISAKCPTGMFGLNSTKKCVSNCLTKMYKNSTTRRCENCPQYCTACRNSTYCTNCTDTALFSAQDNFCYPYCNSTHKFYLEKECVEKCPDGTYLDYTAIHCEKCNEACLTCFGNALNCTQCFQTFKLNGKCLSQCPADYYADKGECKQCKPEIESCSKPLSFEVKQTTQNFQPVLVVKFNQQTVVNGDPKSFVKVRLSMKSRRLQDNDQSRVLQSQADLINDGLEFQAEILPDGTMKLKLQPGMSLDNMKFDVVFTDAAAIKTKNGGAGLQSLQAQIALDTVEVYPTETLQSSASFEIVGLVLSIAILIPVFLLLLCSPVAVFQSLEAFQLISLFAYVAEIPPNLFYFLRQLRFTRLTFLPSIFAKVYQEPNYFTDKIPVNVSYTEGLLSFCVTAGGCTLIGLLYLLVWGVVYLASSKFNNNRSLRNIFTEVYNTRVRFGLLHDLLWIFSINVFVSAFMQFRFTDNDGDVVIGTLFMIGFLAGIIFLIYKLKSYQNIPYQQKQTRQQYKSNLAFYIEGLKQSIYRQQTPSLYYIRKILFTLIVAAVITQSYIQAIILLVIQFIMCLYMIVMRPYVDNFRNFMHFFVQFGVGFVPCGIIYFIKIKEMKEPIGHKIICGQIITYTLICFLAICVIWAYFRAYFFIKQLWSALKETQFFKLYMDQQYENELEKQIRELNDQQNGEIQSVEITNYDAKEKLGEQQNDEDQVIKLKIKRRRIKNKNPVQSEPKQLKPQEKRYNKSEYTKLEQSVIQEPKVEQPKKKIENAEFEKVSFKDDKIELQSNDQNANQTLIQKKQQMKKEQVEKRMRKSIYDEQWTILKFDDKDKKPQNQQTQPENDELLKLQQKQNQLLDEEGYQLENQSNAIISDINQDHDLIEKQEKEKIGQQKSEDIFDMIENEEQQKKQAQKPIEKPQKSVQNFSQLNINVQNEGDEYEQDFDQAQPEDVKLDSIHMTKSHFETTQPKKQIDNWGDLQEIFENEENSERKQEKDKIHKMIFDEEDFDSENHP